MAEDELPAGSGAARLVHLLTELETQEGWHVWIEVTDTGQILAMVKSPNIDIILP